MASLSEQSRRGSLLPRSTLATVLAAVGVAAQEDAVPESRAESIELPRHENGRYFLIDARSDVPDSGAGLLVVLPGGTGSADFLPFVENGVMVAAPADFVGAMPTAVRHEEMREIVWPTERRPVEGMRFSTEEYVDAVVSDVCGRRDIDPERILLLAWSSSGPAAYDIALRPKTPFAGYYVAMSVFRPAPEQLRHAEGVRLVLDHSPDDRVTPFEFAAEARDLLAEHGAEVRLRTYAGGHGWRDGAIPRIRSGLAWLLGGEEGAEDEANAALEGGDDLLRNGSFEEGREGWTVIDNSGTLDVGIDREHAHEGARCLHLVKTGGMPLDLIRQDVALQGGTTVRVSAAVRCAAARNAFVKFFAYDESGASVLDEVDVIHLRGDRDWLAVSRTWRLPPTATRGAVMIVLVLDGELWVDDVRVVAIE